MGLLTEYPAWFILFCLLLGAIYVFFLYFRSDKESIPPWLRLFLEFLRFAAIFLISFLLLSPLFRQNLTTIEKPVIVIGQDNSQSLILGSDSAFIRGEYVNRLNELVAKLENQYDVRTYSFGDRVTSPMNNGFDEKRTDISHFFSEISASYENRNLGAIILASDGICNFGTDPYYTARDLSYPIYTIALGDTTSHRDSRIAHVLFNAQIFLGDDFPVEIQVDANHCDGENASLVVKENSRVVDSCQIPVKGNRFSRQIPVLLEAKQPGWHRYSIELSPINQEVTLENNRQDIFIEVLDMRTKVLIVHDAPHPDIGALKEALERNEKFEVVMRRPEEFLLSDDSAALTIFYQIPSTRGIRISESRIARLPSALFIFGSQLDIQAFNRLNSGMSLSVLKESYTESYPVINEAFPYFTISQSLKKLVPKLPPLQCPFASYQFSSLTEILAYQQLNGIMTQFPLISFIQSADQKRGFISGENFWRWRIMDYRQSGDYQTFDEMIQKIVQFLCVKQDKSYFRVKVKSEFIENETVEMQAELYNKSYELINDPEVSLVITDDKERTYPFSFGRTGSAYFLRAGSFPPGVYSYRAAASAGPDYYEKRGSFVVTSVNMEALNLQADHNLLSRIAESHQGKLLRPYEMNDLPELLKENNEIHSSSYNQKIFSELINSVWVFLLILSFLTVEWALRKYSGL